MTKLDRLRTSVEAVGDSAAAMNSKLDAMGAVVGKCLLVSAAQAETCPRLVWIEEDNPHAASSVSPSRFSHFRRMAWDKVRRKTKEALGRTRFRVRFLCAHDLSLAECGHDGRGYVVDMKDWQRWLQRCLPLLQVQEEFENMPRLESADTQDEVLPAYLPHSRASCAFIVKQ